MEINFTSVGSYIRSSLFGLGSSYASTTFSCILSPIQSVASEVFPYIETIFSYTKVDENNKFLDINSKDSIMNTLKEIKTSLKYDRDVSVYTKVGSSFFSRGGSLSITTPIVFIPYEQLSLKNDSMHFTKAQKEFLIARELISIKNNYGLPKTIYKVALTTYVCAFFCMQSIIIITATISALAGLKLYDNIVQSKQDNIAFDLLTNKYDSTKKAASIAQGAFKKMIDHNLDYRNNSYLGRILINSSGNEKMEILSPTLQDRIEHFALIEKKALN